MFACLFYNNISLYSPSHTCKENKTSNVAAGFGRHGMPPPSVTMTVWPWNWCASRI